MGLSPAAQTGLQSESDAASPAENIHSLNSEPNPQSQFQFPNHPLPFSMPPPPDTRRRGEDDHISGLPDDLLHIILVQLSSAAAAARTSVLSRRWQGVWAHMPELVLCGSPTPSTPLSALLESIDAALDSYAAPTLHSLKIEVSGVEDQWDVPADRIAPWLRFVSQRLAGKLRLRVYLKDDARRYTDVKEELALPICERATEIDIGHLAGFVLRPPPPPPTGSSFSALRYLLISCCQMDGDELGRAVSSPQCPRLRKLGVYVSNLVPGCDISICSESLECLVYNTFNTRKLEVNAPMLREIDVSHRVAEACIVAPMLEMVDWFGRYDPGIHQFAVSRRHLQSLYIRHSTFLGILTSSTRLMERYDSVKELIVSLTLNEEIAGYLTFLKEMDKLTICESLVIKFMASHHALPAIMFHILRRCSCIKKLKLLFLDQNSPPKETSCSVSGCPCLLPENYRLDGITFDSLEEIEIKFFTGSDEQEEFMKLLLSKCNMATLERVDITVPLNPASLEIKVVVERIRSVCQPNSKLQFNVHTKPLPS